MRGGGDGKSPDRGRWEIEYRCRSQRVYSEPRGVGVSDVPGTLLELATGLYMVGSSLRCHPDRRIVTTVTRVTAATPAPGSLTAAIAANPAAAADIMVRIIGDVAIALDAVETESRRRGGAVIDHVKLAEHIAAELQAGQRGLAL